MLYLEGTSKRFEVLRWKLRMELYTLVDYEGGFIGDIVVTGILGKIKGLVFVGSVGQNFLTQPM